MWLDDDGEEPESGSFPDPSTRSWRHPSEIAAENARAAAAANSASPQNVPNPTAVLATTPSSPSIFWPITVVGGCIAVAALGVFGLYLTGASTDTELIASAATTAGDTPSVDGSATALSDVRESEPLGSEGGGAVSADAGAATGSVTGPTTTTTIATTTTTSTIVSTTTSIQILPSQPDLLSGPTLYATADLDPGHIASVIMVDQFLLTSASAIQGHETLSLRVSGTWFDATVTYADVFSDVALITPIIPIGDLDIPVADVGQLVTPGARVYLGYCESDGDPEVVMAELGCNQPIALPSEEATEPEVLPLPDGDKQRIEPPSVERYGQSAPTDPEAGDTDQKAEKSPLERQAKDLRAGTVYSMSQALRTLTDHVIYEPIRTEIPQGDGVAGSPLRDPDGRIIGLVAGSSAPSVAAIPIDRVLAVAQSFVAIGVADPAWLGIEGSSTENGILITAVDEDGPAFGSIQPGDLLDTVGDVKMTEVDHLVHVVREIGPGGKIRIWIERDGARSRVDLIVGSQTN